MHLNTTEGFPKFKVDHNFAKIDDAIGFIPKAWRATKKYSVNNTLPKAAFNTWLQFSLAYVAAVMITDSDVSFITNILNSRIMSAYVYASVILETILIASLAIKYMNRQEVKDEKSKDGDSPIDRKIRGGKSDEINEIAQNALTIKIVPDLVGKKRGFSIVLPISGKQGEILENRRQENRNKIILLTIPYVLSSLIVVAALAKFGFANLQGWKEWTFIAVVGVTTIVGICITLKKLKSNEVNNEHNIVKKVNNLDILLPFRSGTMVLVMENKFESKEKDDFQSQALKLFERFLTSFKNDVCSILDKQLAEANRLFKKDLLDPSTDKIQKTLGRLEGIREDIKENVDVLHKEFSEILNNGKGPTEDVNSLSVADVIKKIYSKVEEFNVRSYIGYFNTQSDHDGHESCNSQMEPSIKNLHDMYNQCLGKVCDLEKKIQELQKSLEEAKNTQNQPNEPNSNSTTPLSIQLDEEKKVEEKNRLLKSKKRTKELEKENAKLEKEFSEQEKADEWKEKINGKPSEFLYYLLESIKLEEKDDQGNTVGKSTLRNFDNKITIYWKDGSQTICHIKKQGQAQPSTKIDFVDPDIQAAFCAVPT